MLNEIILYKCMKSNAKHKWLAVIFYHLINIVFIAINVFIIGRSTQPCPSQLYCLHITNITCHEVILSLDKLCGFFPPSQVYNRYCKAIHIYTLATGHGLNCAKQMATANVCL